MSAATEARLDEAEPAEANQFDHHRNDEKKTLKKEEEEEKEVHTSEAQFFHF
jgi:hypothetical protein